MMTRSEIYAYFYSGDVVSKLSAVRELYGRYGEALYQQVDIMTQLAAVVEDERAVRDQMDAMGMRATCTDCASREGGGCCSRYMAGENDVLQLLMNLLAGVQVGIRGDNPGECCFLGRSGCNLTLKPMFCLNYNCSHIKGKAKMEELRLLEQRTGRLLTRQTVLEQMLLDFFSKNLTRDESCKPK